MDGMQIARRLIAEEREKKTGFLDLGNLRLTEVPVELFELIHLRGLNLGMWYPDDSGEYRQSKNGDEQDANTFDSLSQRFGKLANLVTLSLHGNPVADLGPLAALTALQQLDCSDTQVADLSPILGLQYFNQLTANSCRHLEDFPRQLLCQESLQILILHETIIPGIPAEVLSADGSSDCLEDLRAHMADADGETEEVREAKLVVLGNGRVGKTQICRRLRGLPYDDTVPSTHGITVTAQPWAGSTNEEVLNIWDFGGQDIYHGAHTLFMKTTAVFLIVWHPDFESMGEESADGILSRNYPLPYWLEYVRTLGRKDCPVIVVQTRCEQPEQELRQLPVDAALLKFPSLKPCWYSAKKNRGHGALNDALQDAIEQLRSREGIATIGLGRAKVLRQLEAWRNEDQTRPPEKRQHRTLSQEEFRQLCEQTGGVTSPEHLLAYLHNLGVVFYQPNLFMNRLILDQSWALDAVYAVFDRRQAYPLILSNRGRFTQALLAMTTWRDYSDTDRQLFLSLMVSCEIVFVHREADRKLDLATEYLAPDLLPNKDAVTDQLAGRWNDHDQSWRLEYHYPFLHPGLMRALLCDIGSRSREAGVYWKYGVWLYEQSTGCRAMIEQQMQDERRGCITVTIQGHRHHGLVHWLRKQIEQRNRLFGYLELKPTVDDFDKNLRLPEQPEPRQRMEAQQDHYTAKSVAEQPAQEPTFEKPPESFFPSREPQIFISYAWGDETPAGQLRAKVVDDLCATLGQRGITVLRDRDEMRPGDLISEFMDRLAEGDSILVVISDKYLRSVYCMYELFKIYRNCADKPDRFLKKVIPIILDDSNIDRMTGRLQRAIYWTDQEKEL